MVAKLLLWVVANALVLFLLQARSCDGCLEQERSALLQLRPFFNHPKYLKNWVEGEESLDCCRWDRVECNATTGRVIKLSLDSTRNWRSWNDFGYLNASWFLPFSELKSLNLSHNYIVGCLENEGFEKLSGKLGDLEILDLSQNTLDDSIVSSLSELSSLKSLYLNDNDFKEPDPNNGFQKLSRLSSLETLDLSFNHFGSSIISHLGNLSSLRTLVLKDTGLEGTLHIREMKNFRNLRDLQLSTNQIDSLGSCSDNQIELRLSNLQVLNLSYNLLDNNMLSCLSGLYNITALDIGGNKLKGSVDVKELNTLVNLKQLDMSFNKIESFGSSQDNGSLLRLVNLEYLDLNYNNFTNSVFLSIGHLSALKTLVLSNNKLQGLIDVGKIDGLSNLGELDMSSNQIDQFVAPKGNRSLNKLKVLNLNGALTNGGTLQQILVTYPSVTTLFLKRNNYLNSSMTNQKLHALSNNLVELFLDESSLDNSFLQSIAALTSLKSLSLYSCGLSGSLPNQGWCDLKNLEDLDLSGNAFEGNLPSCLGNLTSLKVLDISNNGFTGNIAASPLTNLTLLRYLSFSNNRFDVPVSLKCFQNNSDLRAIIADGNKLLAEHDFERWHPAFQLNLFSLSNCRSEPPIKELPIFLYYQKDLRYIDVSYNSFGGKFPYWLLENNTRLEILVMRKNFLEGPFKLPLHPNFNILSMDVSSNKIQGPIPVNISSIFPNLQNLFLSRNEIEGSIPASFGDMSSLTRLDLAHNLLSGGIPDQLFHSSLWLLKLSKNNLSGKIPPVIFTETASMWGVYLDGNRFEGELPHTPPPGSSYLVALDISDNNLSGRIPRWIQNVSSLLELALSNNHFEGSIPKELCNLEYLNFLDLSQNNLSGSIPPCFNSFFMSHMHLAGNRLSGPLEAFSNSSSLVVLDLRENDFTGRIPSWLATLPSLSILLLKGNNFIGEIPIALCDLHKLSIMDLSQNKLSGAIPPCLSDLTIQPWSPKAFLDIVSGSGEVFLLVKEIPTLMGTTRFEKSYEEKNLLSSSAVLIPTFVQEDVEFTTKSSSYNYEGNILDYMSGIDLSCNQLTGEIPPQMGNLSAIRSLNLSHNNLTGSIPSTFSKLVQIESLDLSYNNLNGRIPSQLTELYSLAVFSVAHNNLSGTIPDQKAQFGTFDESSYEGNPLLCGPPLLKSCTQTYSSSNVSEDSDSSDFMDMGVFYISFGASYLTILLGILVILYINPYWRRTWFYVAEHCTMACCYAIVDNVHRLSRGFRRLLCKFSTPEV